MQSTKYLRLRQHRHAERMRSASVAAAAGRGHPVIEGSDAMRRAFGAPSVAAAATRNAFAPSASSSSSRHAKCTSHTFMMRRAHSMMHARCAPTGGMVSLSSSARPGASRALASDGGSTWDSLALREELVAAVGEMHLAAPTEVQVAAIPRLIRTSANIPDGIVPMARCEWPSPPSIRLTFVRARTHTHIRTQRAGTR